MNISFIDTNKYYLKEKNDNPSNFPKSEPEEEKKNSSEEKVEEDEEKLDVSLVEKTKIKTKNVCVLSKDKLVNSFAKLKTFYNHFYDTVLSILILALSTGLFYIFSQSVKGKFESHWTWTLPILIFSVYIIFLTIFLLTVHTRQILWTVLSLSFLASGIFAAHFFHFVAIILMFFYVIYSARQMRKALVDSVTIHFGNLVRLGIGDVIFSVIIILSSQYYWMVYNQSLAEILFHFENVKVSEKVLDKYLSSKSETGEDSNQESLRSSQITVDEFLLILTEDNEEDVLNPEASANTSVEKNEENGMIGSFFSNIGFSKDSVSEKVDDFKESAVNKKDEVLVDLMRKNLSKHLGQELQGDENIAEVFDKAMYEKLASYFVKEEDEEESKISYLALILTGLLFLSFLTLRTFLAPVLIYLTIGVLYILRKLNIIKVVKVERETEMIILPSAV